LNDEVNTYIDALKELDNITRIENGLDPTITDVEQFETWDVSEVKWGLFTQLGRLYYQQIISDEQ
jgi:hypothetical protein